MRSHFIPLDVFRQRKRLRDSGVGDHDVEVLDAVFLLELVDDGEGVLLNAGVVFDKDQAAA